MHRQIAGRLTGPITKWIVFFGVLIAMVVFSGLGAKLGDVKNNEASSWLPSSAEATEVANEISADVNPNDIPTLVVYHRAGGLTDADFAAMDDQAEEIAQIKGVTDQGVLTPNGARALEGQGGNAPTLVSDDGEVAYTYLVFNFGKDGWNAVPDPVKDIRKITKIDGVDVYVGGYGGQAADFAESFEGSHTNLLMISFLVVIIILLITYRSALLWLLPIISAVVANQIAGGVVYLLAKYTDMVVNDQSQYILSILVIGAGTDYALLLVARYREELRRHADRHEAMAYALHRSAPAIIASAATVVVGLMCLAFADLNSTASLGPVLAVGVAVTLLVMVTFLPAALVICGRWVFGPGPEQQSRRTWSRVAQWMSGVGLVAAVAGGFLVGGDGAAKVLGLVLMIPGALALVLGLLMLAQAGIERWTSVHSRPDFGSVEPTSTGLWAKVGNKIAPRPRAVWVVTSVLLGIACLGLFQLDATGLTTEDSVTDEIPAITAMKLMDEHGLADNSNTIQVVSDTSEVSQVQSAVADTSGLGRSTDVKDLGDGRSWFEYPIKKDMASHAAWDILQEVRDKAHAVSGADAKVGGSAGFYLDTKTASDHDNKLIIPMVLLVVLLILMILLRALVAPVILLATVVLSFGAALGLSSLVFQYLFGFDGADPGFPLFAFVFLVALGIDYNIFLMTRVREETINHGTRKGSLIALSSTGGVITSAGLVLAATFGALATLPLVFLVELGTAVALGVLLDTMIVRSVLVTALNLDLGSKIWWPSKIDRGGRDVPEPGAEPEREKVPAL
ncbi:MMPL family transporter [Nocardioides sp. MH1]|uniref:MMPL family transporter n=1 Tax=Nocardioides sp. MH1 TaxID=3242490 RepID=UPI003522594B